MNKTILFLFLMSSITFLFAQDIIYITDGTEIKTKIIEITAETIKYKKFEQLEGPVRNILLSDVFMVIYQDGTREVFKKTEQPKNEETDKKELPQQVPLNIPKPQEKVETIKENRPAAEKVEKSPPQKSLKLHFGISAGFNSSKWSGDDFLEDGENEMVRIQGLTISSNLLLERNNAAVQFEIIYPNPKGFRGNSTVISNYYFEYRLNYIDFVISPKTYLNKEDQKIFIKTSLDMGILTDGKIVYQEVIYKYNTYTHQYEFDHLEGPYKINFFNENSGFKRVDWSWGLAFGLDFYLKKNQIITTEFKYVSSFIKLDDKEDPWDYDIYNSLFGLSLYYYW